MAYLHTWKHLKLPNFVEGGPPTSYKYGYKSTYRGYNPSYPIRRPFIRVITPFITSRGPPCRVNKGFGLLEGGGIQGTVAYLDHPLINVFIANQASWLPRCIDQSPSRTRIADHGVALDGWRKPNKVKFHGNLPSLKFRWWFHPGRFSGSSC